MKIGELAIKILQKLYDEAEPGVDFQYVLENPEEFGEEWYLNHYLEQSRQEKIVNDMIEEFSEEYNLTTSQKTKLRTTVTLGYGPTNVEPDK